MVVASSSFIARVNKYLEKWYGLREFLELYPMVHIYWNSDVKSWASEIYLATRIYIICVNYSLIYGTLL